MSVPLEEQRSSEIVVRISDKRKALVSGSVAATRRSALADAEGGFRLAYGHNANAIIAPVAHLYRPSMKLGFPR